MLHLRLQFWSLCYTMFPIRGSISKCVRWNDQWEICMSCLYSHWSRSLQILSCSKTYFPTSQIVTFCSSISEYGGSFCSGSRIKLLHAMLHYFKCNLQVTQNLQEHATMQKRTRVVHALQTDFQNYFVLSQAQGNVWKISFHIWSCIYEFNASTSAVLKSQCIFASRWEK